jgi:OOP family OmpA-OmpF porin
MTTPLRKKRMLKKITLALLISTAAAGAFAQTITDIQAKSSSAYAQDGRGNIVRNPYGLCWRTGYWTPADAVPGCDGELVPPVAKPIAPPVAAAPVAAPAPAPVAPPPPKRCDFSVTLQSDETFAFNKAVLTDAAKKRIDSDVMSKLDACGKIDIVIVTGHTDRLGTQQYNQKLSDKRAEAVAAYLKSKGVSAPLDTLGVGKTQSIKPCSDSLKRKEMIECLAPNRRVVIEARGIAK